MSQNVKQRRIARRSNGWLDGSVRHEIEASWIALSCFLTLVLSAYTISRLCMVVNAL